MKHLDPLVLIIDDDEQLLRLLAKGMKKHGFQTLEALSAAAALKILRENSKKPDVIVSDIIMPGVDGFQFCKLVREDSQLSSLPILLLSSRRMVKDRIRGLEAGADDYMTKPFHLSELIARLRALHRRSQFSSQIKDTIRKRDSKPVNKASKTIQNSDNRVSDSKSEGVSGESSGAFESGSFEDGENHFKAGEFEEAYDIWKALSQKKRGDANIERWLEIARHNLMRRYEKAFGSKASIPVVIRKGLNSLKLDATQGFIMSRIDGRCSISGLCQNSGLGKMATLRILYKLLDLGVIRLQHRSSVKRGRK